MVVDKHCIGPALHSLGAFFYNRLTIIVIRSLEFTHSDNRKARVKLWRELAQVSGLGNQTTSGD